MVFIFFFSENIIAKISKYHDSIAFEYTASFIFRGVIFGRCDGMKNLIHPNLVLMYYLYCHIVRRMCPRLTHYFQVSVFTYNFCVFMVEYQHNFFGKKHPCQCSFWFFLLGRAESYSAGGMPLVFVECDSFENDVMARLFSVCVPPPCPAS